MRIPNKFNGYMSDGRRLYPDPATSAIIASSLAEGAAAATAATTAATAAAAAPTLAATAAGASAIPGIVGSAAPALSAAAPAATTAAQGLGAGVQAMSPEIAANLAQSQAANQGIMNSAGQLTGAADSTAAMNMNQVGAMNLPTNMPVTPDVASGPVGLQSAVPNASTVNPGYESAVAHTKDIETAAKVGKEFEAAQAAEKYANMNPLEKGMFKAKELAGDIGKFTKDNQLLTTGGIMLAQNLMQPSYNQPTKKKYSGSGSSGSGNFKYGEPSTGTYTPIFEPTPYAVGGSVEDMSAQNAVGGNMMYPQSQMNTPMYSNPMMSRPIPTNVINTGIDAPAGSYTGEPNISGGVNGYGQMGNTSSQPSGAANTQQALGNMASVYTNPQGYAEGGKLSAFERMMREEEARKKKSDAQARADLEEGKSVASKTKPYSRTQTTNSPYAAALKEFQALNKKYGIPVAAPAKTNVDLMGDQDQIEYAANGGIMHGLGGYSDGGRLLKGPGDGVSDSIPAVIGNKQPARLADGEFVIPARIVSEMGNGSTAAGARKLYAMMERVQKRRGKTTGKGKVAVNSKADKHLPA